MARDLRARESFTGYGIVLRNTPLGESDSVLTILLENRGKVAVLARGLRRSKKRFMGGLDLFDWAKFTLEERGESMAILDSASEKRNFSGISSDLAAFAAASLALEVLNFLALDRDPEGGAYIAPFLQMLSDLGADRSVPALAKFLVQTLTLAGFSDFETLTARKPLLGSWLFGEGAMPQAEETEALLKELIRSIEIIYGKPLTTAQTARRFLFKGEKWS